MAEHKDKQVRQHFECEKSNLVNTTIQQIENKLARRAEIMCRGYNRAMRRRIAQVAS